MTMYKYIEKLRQKSDTAKKRFAFLVSFLFVGIIFVVWLSVIYPGFREQKNINDKISANESSPLSTFKDIFSQGSSEIGNQFSKIKNVGSVFSNDPEYINQTSTTSTSTTTSTTTKVSATTTESY